MAKLLDSVKAFGEKATGEKIEGNTLFEAMKDMGEKMTGKEITGKNLVEVLDETTEEYQGGGGVVKVDELPENPEPLTIYEITRVIPPAPTGILSLAKAISKDFNLNSSEAYVIASDSQIEPDENDAKYYNYTNDTWIEISSGQKYVTNSEGNVGFFPSERECIVKEYKGKDPSDPENKVLVVTLDGKEVSIERDNYDYIDILKELSGKNLIMINTAYQTKVVEDIENEITAEYLINNDLIYKHCPEDVFSFYNGLEQYITEDGRCFGLFTSGEITFDVDNYRFVKNGEPYTGKFTSEWREVNDEDAGMYYKGPYPLEVRNTPKFCSSGEIYILDAPEPGPAPEPTVVTEHYIWQDKKWYNLDNLPSATTEINIGVGKNITLNTTKLLELLIEKGVDVDAEMSAGYGTPWYSGIAIGTQYYHGPMFDAALLGISPTLSSGDVYMDFKFNDIYEQETSKNIHRDDPVTIREFLSAINSITISNTWSAHTILPCLGVMTDSEEAMHSYTLTNEEFDSIIEIS